MYLLNLTDAEENHIHGNIFTFHYVSIKSDRRYARDCLIIKFTFHYVSIKSIFDIKTGLGGDYLHSTMYLLNPVTSSVLSFANAFTFHYVSIKSCPLLCPLSHTTQFTFHYVSIKST